MHRARPVRRIMFVAGTVGGHRDHRDRHAGVRPRRAAADLADGGSDPAEASTRSDACATTSRSKRRSERYGSTTAAGDASTPARRPKPSAQVVAVPIRTKLPAGAYVVTWRVISADSHPVQGSFTFQVGTARERDRSRGASARRQPAEQDRWEQGRRRHLRRRALARLRCARVADRQCRLRGPDLAETVRGHAGCGCSSWTGWTALVVGDGGVVPARRPLRRGTRAQRGMETERDRRRARHALRTRPRRPTRAARPRVPAAARISSDARPAAQRPAGRSHLVARGRGRARRRRAAHREPRRPR